MHVASFKASEAGDFAALFKLRRISKLCGAAVELWFTMYDTDDTEIRTGC